MQNLTNTTCEYQPDNLDDNLIDKNHEDCSYLKKEIKSKTSGETMKCRKVRRALLYYVPKRILSLKKFAHYVLLLFYSFRDKKEL